MSRRLVIRPIARREIVKSTQWYADRDTRVGRRFVDAVERALVAVRDDPLRYPVARDRRRLVFKDFPYSLIYTVKVDEIIVLACFHGSRNPAGWRRRK